MVCPSWWSDNLWSVLGVGGLHHYKLSLWIIVCRGGVFHYIFFPGVLSVTMPTLELCYFLCVEWVFVAIQGGRWYKGFLARITGVDFHCFRFRPKGCLDCSIAIQASSVLSGMLMFPVVCIMIVAMTSFTVWLSDVKWQETGFTPLRFLISAKCPRSRSLPLWLTYCRPHFKQLRTYIKFFVLQLKQPLMGTFCFVTWHLK